MLKLSALAATPGFLAYLASLIVMGGLAAMEIVRGNGGRAFAWVVAILLVATAFRFGEDFLHHVHRIATLAEQVRLGEPSLLVTNLGSGEVLPLFVYYSFVPYLPATALHLAGLSAHAAFRVMLGVTLIILVLGLVRLIRLDRRVGATHTAFLAAILFLGANYAHNLWLARQAYAEIWVYCLIPWVTLTLLRPRAIIPLAALLFLQMISHPLVFAQAFACALLIAWVLSKEAPVVILQRYAGATALALLLAAPFWLPQVLWQTLILGPAGLPARFGDEFLSIGDLVDLRNLRGLGFVLPIALVLMIVLSRGRLPTRAWVLLAAVLALVAIQTEPLRPVAELIPLLSTSLYVWRLMLPAALLAFALLLVGWPPPPGRNAVLASLALLSLACLAVVQAARAPRSLQPFATMVEADWIRGYANETGWGRLEFLPNYAHLPGRCGEAQRLLFADLQQGVRTTSPYVVVASAPLPGIDYLADGKTAPLSTCDRDLVIGPLAPGADLRVSLSTLTLVLQARLAALAMCAIGLLAHALRRRPVVKPAAA